MSPYFVSAFIGAFVGGFFVIGSNWLKHCWLRKEHTQDILVHERVKAYNELNHYLADLLWVLPSAQLTQMGIDILRWPKDSEKSPKFFDNGESPQVKEEREFARNIFQKTERLKKFMRNHIPILSKNVQLAFWEDFTEFTGWRNIAEKYSDAQLIEKYPGYIEDIIRLLYRLYDHTINCITKDLDVKGFEGPSTEELIAARQKGVNKLKNYSKEGCSKLETKKQRDGSSFDNTIVNNRRHIPFS